MQAVETVCSEVVVDDPAAVWTRWREEVQRPRIGRQVQTMCAVVAKRVAKSHCGDHRWSRISRSNFGTTDDAVDHAATIGIELQAVVAVVHEIVTHHDHVERRNTIIGDTDAVLGVAERLDSVRTEQRGVPNHVVLEHGLRPRSDRAGGVGQ